jgi:hypothetical protein
MPTQLSEIILSKLFKINGYFLTDIKEQKKVIILNIKPLNACVCPKCHKPCPRYDFTTQRIYIGSILRKPIFCEFKV